MKTARLKQVMFICLNVPWNMLMLVCTYLNLIRGKSKLQLHTNKGCHLSVSKNRTEIGVEKHGTTEQNMTYLFVLVNKMIIGAQPPSW